MVLYHTVLYDMVRYVCVLHIKPFFLPVDIRYDRVWLCYGYAMGWCGMARFGGTVLYGMVWYGVWYGMVWHGMAWHGVVWYGMVWYGPTSKTQGSKNLRSAESFSVRMMCGSFEDRTRRQRHEYRQQRQAQQNDGTEVTSSIHLSYNRVAVLAVPPF